MKTTTKESQNQKVINWLMKPGRTLTRMQAFKKWRFMTLNSRVAEINATKKHKITSEMIKLKGGQRVAKYTMLY